jgi:dTDP-4-dehydrorhamnose reductase
MIWLVGRDGRLGSALGRAFSEAGVSWIGSGREVDIGNFQAIERFLQGRRIETLVNAAAYTAVDLAETEPERCYAANVLGPRNLASWATAVGAAMVHFSTDFVFSGSGPMPMDEDAAVYPLGVYANSKWEGEEEVRGLCSRHLILRTAWLYGEGRPGFVETILQRLAMGDIARVVQDQWGCPTWTKALAALVVGILQKGILHWGTYHVAGSGFASRYKLACEIQSQAAACGLFPRNQLGSIVPIPSSEFPTAAPRPGWSVLSTEKLKATFGLELPPWQSCLREYLSSLPRLD